MPINPRSIVLRTHAISAHALSLACEEERDELPGGEKTSMSTESVECEGCTALAYLYLKGAVLAKSRHAAVNVPSSFDVFSGRLSRVVLRANFPSESYAGKVVAITKNFEGVKKVEKWRGKDGVVAVGRMDPERLRLWMEAVTGLEVRVVVVSATVTTVAGEEVWFKTMLHSCADKLLHVVLHLKGVKTASVTPLEYNMYLFKVKGAIDHSKLLSSIELLRSVHQPPVPAHHRTAVPETKPCHRATPRVRLRLKKAKAEKVNAKGKGVDDAEQAAMEALAVPFDQIYLS